MMDCSVVVGQLLGLEEVISVESVREVVIGEICPIQILDIGQC